MRVSGEIGSFGLGFDAQEHLLSLKEHCETITSNSAQYKQMMKAMLRQFSSYKGVPPFSHDSIKKVSKKVGFRTQNLQITLKVIWSFALM